MRLIRLLSALAFVFTLLPSVVHAGDPTDLQTTLLGRGSALSIARAATMDPMDDGATGALNPAAFLLDRNEIYGEGDLFGAWTFQTGITNPEFRPAQGQISYLLAALGGSAGINWMPVARFNAGAKFGDAERVYRQNVDVLEFVYAREWIDGVSLGVGLGFLHGGILTGTRNEAGISPDKFEPRLFSWRIGAQSLRGDGRWSVALDLPSFGSIRHTQYELTGGRSREHLGYRGRSMLHAGYSFPVLNGHAAFSATFSPFGASFDDFNRSTQAVDDSGEEYPPAWSIGASLHAPWDEQLTMMLGTRYEQGGEHPDSQMLLGLGAEYQISTELFLIGSAGMMLPFDQEYYVLDDVFPLVLRAGAGFRSNE